MRLKTGLLGLAVLVAGATLSGCTTTGKYLGIYGTLTLPGGKAAQVYAAVPDYDPLTPFPDPNKPAPPPAPYSPFGGTKANVIIYTGDDCMATYYGGDNAKLDIAQDMSKATLTVKKTDWGPLTMTITRGGPAVPVTVPAPKQCATTNTSGTQQYVVAAGASGTDNWSVGSASGTSDGMIGTVVYQASYENLLSNLLGTSAHTSAGSSAGTSAPKHAPAAVSSLSASWAVRPASALQRARGIREL